MNWLLSTDLHLSDRARDAYRFGIFPWLKQQQQKHKVDATFLLGDLTESKDRHSSTLVNRIVEELLTLASPVYILRGNHDGVDPNSPFFKFLNSINGLNFVVKPTFLHKYEIAMIPHCADQAVLKNACAQMPINPKAAFCHNTFQGAIAETGAVLSGLSASPVSALKPWLGVYSGDIHVPQRCADITYVGAPYAIRFNDTFEPRVLLIKGGGVHNLRFPAPRKVTLRISSPDQIHKANLSPKDQVKLIITLKNEELLDWARTKQAMLVTCKECKLEVFGVEAEIVKQENKQKNVAPTKSNNPKDILNAFCRNEDVAPSIASVGADLLEG